jgi:hypothetical protein
MAASRHHAEWLSLIEVSGPFLTLPVLERVFPQGLDKDDSPEAKEHARNLRLAYDEWDDNQSSHHPNPAIHKAWINFVLRQTLGLPEEVLADEQKNPQTIKATVAEHNETLRPDFVVRHPEGIPNAGKARLLVQVYSVEQDLERPVAGRHWKASPATRMMELLHATDVRLGLVTNGEHWMLVDAPRGDTTGFASWYASLWFDEPLTLRAFRSLLGVSRFFSVADDETLEAMLKESAEHQQEVTDQLGLQVRRAVEVLIQSLDRADQDHGWELLADVPEAVLYEAALTVMMRLVFLFSAEERGLLLLGDPLYDQHYAVSTLVAQLQEAADQHGEEVLERRLDAWARLLSTFRVVFGGVKHERMKLPAYAGNLFNPDRFPFLEGRRPGTTWRDTPATPLPVNNRTVLHLLRALQYLQGEHKDDPAVRLSFQSLDIEQIGHVYEGLLDHTAKRATEPMLGLLGAKGKEPEVALAELERLGGKGKADLLAVLGEQTGRQEKTLKRGLDTPLDGEESKKLRAICGNEEKLFRRVVPFSGLLRYDTFDRPVVIRKGSVFVTAGSDRRSTGTHYTPRSLTEPIVQYTLEPLVYVGPAEGKPKEEWKLRSAKELLDLKICDMSCGSGAFLVQGCRYLSELLVEAWEQAEERIPSEPGITPEGTASRGKPGETLIPKDTDERLVYARRLIAQRCLYGVDKNPLAVEMAKLSLWLLTLAKDKPFEFLDHAIRCGDSLIGLHDLEQVRHYSLKPEADDAVLFKGPLDSAVDEAINLRLKIEDMPTNTVEDVERQEKLLKEASDKIARLRCAADLLVAAEFWGENLKDKAERVQHSAIKSGYLVEKGPTEEFAQAAAKERRGQLMFHWPLEYPEVIVKRDGFDAFVGNPPFMGGRIIGRVLGEEYLNFLAHIRNNIKGSPDLCAYFLLRAFSLLRQNCTFGLLATKSISETGSRVVCLEQLRNLGATLYCAHSRKRWPGSASVVVAVIHVVEGKWNGVALLDDSIVDSISSGLDTEMPDVAPMKLAALRGQYSQGQDTMGRGFELTQEELDELLSSDPSCKEVIFPYYNGLDINSMSVLTPYRWVIYFRDWPENRARQYKAAFRRVEKLVKPYRDALTGQIHQQCFWKFWDLRPRLMQQIDKHTHLLALAAATKYVSFRRVPTSNIYNKRAKLLFLTDWWHFAVLQSSFHQDWAAWRSGTLGGTTITYSSSESLETWPMPYVAADARKEKELNVIGEDFHETREQVMASFDEGLTDIYNRFHNPDEKSDCIRQLRELHVKMDQAVAAAYGWDDLELGHDFHETKQGIRFTISEPTRREVLARLLRLNHERYAEEIKQGLPEKKGKAKKPSSSRGRKKPTSTGGASLFDEGDEEEPPPAEAGKERRRQVEEATSRPTPTGQLDTDDIIAAFRQATRGRGWLDRDELLKEVSVALGYQRLGPKIEEVLRGHLRAASRRRIIKADGANLVRAGTGTMADYGLDELREMYRSVMRKGASYEREDVIHALARYLGFTRVTDTSRDAIKSAINSAIRHGVLGYEGVLIWRVE